MTTSTEPTIDASAQLIELTVPANTEAARILRAVSSSVASGIPFGYDRIEDLALAIDEAFAFLIESGPDIVRCTLSKEPAAIRVMMTASPAGDDASSEWASCLNRVVLESMARDVQQDIGRISFVVEAVVSLD